MTYPNPPPTTYRTVKAAGALSLLITALLAAGACGSGQPTASATPTQSPAVAPTTAAQPATEVEQGMPTYRINQEWQTADWRVKVTGMRCGPVAQLNVDWEIQPGEQDACIVAVAYVNISALPAAFNSGSAADPGPAYAVGMDAQGRLYDGWNWAQQEVNPGLGGKTDLVFPVPTKVRIVTVTIGDVAVELQGQK